MNETNSYIWRGSKIKNTANAGVSKMYMSLHQITLHKHKPWVCFSEVALRFKWSWHGYLNQEMYTNSQFSCSQWLYFCSATSEIDILSTLDNRENLQ